MVTKTTTRPVPRSSQSHSQTQSQRPTTKMPSNTPLGPPGRAASSVGQSMPPNAGPYLRSPSIHNTDVRTPSPNYFGLTVNPASDPRESGIGPQNNWSPPTSSILSFGANSPLPLDANPEFEAFKRQTEGGSRFSLSHGSLSHFASTPSALPRSKPDLLRRGTTQDHPSPMSKPQGQAGNSDAMDLDGPTSAGSIQAGAPSFFDLMPRTESPMNMTLPKAVDRSTNSRLDERHPRLSLPQNRANPPSMGLKLPQKAVQHRADTLPSTLEEGPTLISTKQLKEMMERLPSTEFLLLDLRVFPQFASSRIQGALNLCIPTTLLKRPSFNLQKLQDTFTNEEEKARFAQWKGCKSLVVYDAQSSEKKDALSAVNTLKKFSNEGWNGNSYIVRGGFAEFSATFPQLIDHKSVQGEMPSSKVSLSLTGPGVAPVAGGCAMPPTKNAANPFFSNIRQNTDLIGGVGQMDVQVPEELTPGTRDQLPRWLIKAAAADNKGKMVSDKFLKLELAEQARMTKALSSGVSYGTPAADRKQVQIAGIEKGSKNRYNNIWPFEHARVRLQGRPAGTCDYVNASHIKAARSNKQYIASQGPLPATFEDFWSIIWDQDIRVIVMLTAESEGGQLKCHPYWDSKVFGSMKLKALSEKRVSLDFNKKHRATTERRDREAGRKRANTASETAAPLPAAEPPYAIIRKFTLAHSSHPFSPIREITQVHYSSWPDFGAPASPGQLLGLVELSNLVQRASMATGKTRSDEPEAQENSRPMLVHCSAGCGRTGTFCTIDSVIDMLKRQRKEMKSGTTPMEGMSSSSSKTPDSNGDFMWNESKENKEVEGDWIFDQDVDLVEKTVEEFRGQRLSMVQSLRQYVLCYETVLEWITQQHYGTGARPSLGHERSSSEAVVRMS